MAVLGGRERNQISLWDTQIGVPAGRGGGGVLDARYSRSYSLLEIFAFLKLFFLNFRCVARIPDKWRRKRNDN